MTPELPSSEEVTGEAVPVSEPAEGRRRVFAPRSPSLEREWGGRDPEEESPAFEGISEATRGLRFLERLTGLRGRREDAPDFQAARGQAAPTIRVSIGRIEIRPLSEKPAGKAARAEEPAVSLDAYLRERRRESW